MSANAICGNDIANISVFFETTNDIRHKVLFHRSFDWQSIHLSFGLSLLPTVDLLAIDAGYLLFVHLLSS